MRKEPGTINKNHAQNNNNDTDKGVVTYQSDIPGPRSWVKGLRPDRPIGTTGPRLSPTCIDCPIHLEGDTWKDKLFRLGGKPMVCNGIKKRNGCGDRRARVAMVSRYHKAIARYLVDHPEEAVAMGEVGSSA